MITIAILIAALTYLLFKWIRTSRKLPPGPLGVPVLGYLPFIDPLKPHITLTNLSKIYGPIYSLRMGEVLTVVLSNDKIVREAFAKDVFAGRAPLYLTHGIMQGNGIICAEGALWRDQRKLVTFWLKQFGMSKHGCNRTNLQERIDSGVNEIKLSIQSKEKEPVDLKELITNHIGNVMNDLVFGLKFPNDDFTWNWIRNIQEEGCEAMGVAGVLNFLPFVRFFSKSARDTMEFLVRGQKQTHRIYASLIAKRRESIGLRPPPGCAYPGHTDILEDNRSGVVECIRYGKGKGTSEKHFFDPSVLIPCEGSCILDSFLRVQHERFTDNADNAMYVSDEQLLYLLGDLFGAGLDTSAITFQWFFLFMALYPDIQEWIREELLEVMAKHEEDCTIDETPRLFAALCETQRIRSIVPVGIPHGALQDCELAGYRIPKGTMVVPLQWAIHMDPKVWDEPEKFKPQRFLSEDNMILKPAEFIPFQTGKRMCPGDELYRMIAMSVCGGIMSSYAIRLCSETPDESALAGFVGVTLAPPSVLYYFDLL